MSAFVQQLLLTPMTACLEFDELGLLRPLCRIPLLWQGQGPIDIQIDGFTLTNSALTCGGLLRKAIYAVSELRKDAAGARDSRSCRIRFPGRSQRASAYGHVARLVLRNNTSPQYKKR
jgi:hypothetical protein